ncbi:MAG: GNAT family N-acetyltransferase [Telluria sp.]|nr:GNAT family N-acetyltransferase [Telluria sp.]
MFVSTCDPDSADARVLVDELSGALAAITGDSGASSFSADDTRVARACFVIARDGDGELLGCGALRPMDEHSGEIKRMYARPGTGAGAALLAYLEGEAARFGYRELRLSTRKVNLRAVRFYEKHGYRAVPAFGKYIGRDEAICLGKSVFL